MVICIDYNYGNVQVGTLAFDSTSVHLQRTTNLQAMSYGWYKGPICGRERCPSTRYHDNETGMPICQQGHEHPELRKRAEQDEDEFLLSSQGRITKKVRERAEKDIQRK